MSPPRHELRRLIRTNLRRTVEIYEAGTAGPFALVDIKSHTNTRRHTLSCIAIVLRCLHSHTATLLISKPNANHQQCYYSTETLMLSSQLTLTSVWFDLASPLQKSAL